MNVIVDSLRAEYVRYKALAEAAIRQLTDEEVSTGPQGGNSIASICWHVAGNLRSRFTDFLTTDGEKPWRRREEEFAPRNVTREALLDEWDRGWAALLGALDELSDAELERVVTIRGQPLKVHEALHRSLAHASYHVGQIVLLSRMLRGVEWSYLSIPPGASADYNLNPVLDRPASQAVLLDGRDGSR